MPAWKWAKAAAGLQKYAILLVVMSNLGGLTAEAQAACTCQLVKLLRLAA